MAPMRRIALVLLLATAAFAQGCTLSHANIRKADAIVMQAQDAVPTCHQPDNCAAPSALLDQANAELASSTADAPHHAIGLLEDGESAMVARLNLIRGARHSIDVQTYIWQQDDAGKLILDQLVEAARRGVKVRILADQLFAFGDAKLLATLARTRANFEVRLYNPTFRKAHTPPLEFAAGVVCCFLRFNQRMHNKLLLVDDAIGITGGRNYEDRYFDWNDEFDYRDRDVVVGGPVARTMATSFDTFWNHKRSVPLTHLRDVNRQIRSDGPDAPRWVEPAYSRPDRVSDALAEAADPQWVQEHLVANSIPVGRVDYLSDLPGKTEKPADREDRELTGRIMGMLSAARREVVLQTPYLVLSDRAKKLFRALHKRPDAPRVVVSTNSLASTDAFAVYAISYKHRKAYFTKYGFEIYEMKPQVEDRPDTDEGVSYDVFHAPSGGRRNASPSEEPGLFGSRNGRGRRNRPAPLRTAGMRIGLHAKSIVVDDSFAMVGTHNFDPRSDHYNTESGVVVYDRPFADALRASIMSDTRPENAWVVAPRKPTIPVLGQISEALGDVSEKLPLFDLWPFRYTTNYDLNPGCMPKRPNDAQFFQCYHAVGDFPEVNLSLKMIYTRLLTAFGSASSGIL
ncbi:MAG TPA: phospholipase D family protein [Pinirhizobacter sp.]